MWDSLVKRRVEAESWEKEAREKDLSLAEVSNFVWAASKYFIRLRSGGSGGTVGEVGGVEGRISQSKST